MKQTCHLCKREIKKKERCTTWCLRWYDLADFIVCEECELSVERQIYDNLTYFVNINKELKDARK